MTAAAPRSIDQYLSQLRAALAGEDAALIQDALYDAEEYLRAEVAAHSDKSESDVLELIASTYGDPEEVAAAYRDTEVKVKAALKTPTRATATEKGTLRKFFDVYLDPRAYMSVFFMLLTLATGIIYFTFAVTGLSLSAGLAVLIIGVPFFLAFIGLSRVLSLAEGRLIEAVTGERMPRRPVHPGPSAGFWSRVGSMLKDARTWTTLAYFMLMLPIGIAYFTITVVALVISLSFIFAPAAELGIRLGLLPHSLWGNGDFQFASADLSPAWIGTTWLLPVWVLLGVVLLTVYLHTARGVGRLHAGFAKAMLVAR
jgi:uncharacterized membrane protein